MKNSWMQNGSHSLSYLSVMPHTLMITSFSPLYVIQSNCIYFLVNLLFLQSDNDFISIHGISLGKPFDAGLDVDNQFLVFRVTLPGAALKP